ncbi:MAG: S41 family peptidase [Bacteroides sp.]
MSVNKLSYLLYILLIPLFYSCGEDRTGEYEALIAEDKWIEEVMCDRYLWYYDIPASDKLKFFAEPKDFFPTLLSKNDKFSYIKINTPTTKAISSESSYGFDFILYKDPIVSTSNDRFARVLYVLPNSPASEAGLKRGDWISAVKGQKLTTANYGYLLQGESRKFATAAIVPAAGGAYQWQANDTLTLSASRQIEDNPFYVDTVYNVANRKIAYLMYNSFSTGPNNQAADKAYGDQMRSIFANFKAANVNDFILDLRYNQGGYLTCSQELSSLLAPATALGKVYCSLVFNDKHLKSNFSLNLEEKLTGGANLNLSRLYVITSNLTASASEAVINCLQPYMGTENVILVGTKTVGKNVASEPINSDVYTSFTLYPILATVFNSENKSDYANGIVPTHILDEGSFLTPFYQLGDLRERMLYNTVQLITTGTMPDEKKTEVNPAHLMTPIYNSLDRKKMSGVLIQTKDTK